MKNEKTINKDLKVRIVAIFSLSLFTQMWLNLHFQIVQMANKSIMQDTGDGENKQRIHPQEAHFKILGWKS